MPEICVVLGMHKSGTTLVSEILHHSGIRMVENDSVESYDHGNHFEREDTNQFNKRLLGCGEASSIRSQHPHLTELLRLCAGLQAREGETKIVLAYSARKQRDAMGAAEIKAMIGTAILKGDDRFKDHALLYLLQRKGELGRFLQENLLA
jgi:hypothetical protein